MAEGNTNIESAGYNKKVRGAKTKDLIEWIPYAIDTVLHPITLSRTLVQLGYEPIAPRPGKSLFGRPVMVLPGCMEYIRHVRSVDGIMGCYRGVTPRLIGGGLGFICSQKLVECIGLKYREPKEDDTKKEVLRGLANNVGYNAVLTTVAVIVNHPFHVISVRMMAQFIGRETLYKSIWGSIREIYNTEGLAGFFSGFVPKLICELFAVSITNVIFYLGFKYFSKDRFANAYVTGVTSAAVRALMYPLQVITTCMCVSGSRLAAGQPPFMPVYLKWVDCYRHLHHQQELCRGSSMVFRSVSTNAKQYLRFDNGAFKTFSVYRNE